MDVYICDGIRTPFGRYGGSLSSVRPDDMAALIIRELLKRNKEIDPTDIDDVIFGCANQAGEDNRNVARMATLLANLPPTVPSTTINRLCGSSLDAVSMGFRSIKSGEASLIIAGGVESMSRAPYVMGKAESIFSRSLKIEDTTMGWRFINPAMRKLYGAETMPETAENLAKEYGISREEQDFFALHSQNKVARAYEQNLFDDEIIAVHIPQKKGEDIVFSRDEHPRETSLESLSKLKSIVIDDGSVTAGNSSGINDGASVVLLSNEDASIRNKLSPKARILSSAVAGVEPRIMGIGPVPAINKALRLANLTLDQIDIIELNEAFAAQCLSVMKALDIDINDERVNRYGGAIALGHPLGASGTRLIATAYHQLVRTKKRYAICSMCIGVGQGIAVVIERI